FWLFGSFMNLDWTNIWFLFIPALAISFLALLWAREFNLVLLGEEQAKQMGLNVKLFNRAIMIMASVLTAICVSFVGIIGFVGLVVPHTCRMILGGDHRFVLPASIVLGGILMLAAALVARTAFDVIVPVGAITAIIGAPVFAYLLIKKGRMYSG
ncbi:MAG: iron ABC transporter permease, partial [Methanomassiliicoccaceae archaeon]|nr:iron ABC transporter permease [Methanomassiliicoccaceae archaeon]